MNLTLAAIAADAEAGMGLARHGRTDLWKNRKSATESMLSAADIYHKNPSVETAEHALSVAFEMAEIFPVSLSVHHVVRRAIQAVVDSKHPAAASMQRALGISETLIDVERIIPTLRAEWDARMSAHDKARTVNRNHAGE